MTPRRREVEKLYNKIYKLAQKGSEYVFEYFALIDEVVSSGKYSILEDVMLTKFDISVRNFLSIQDFKEFSFKEIRKFTHENSVEALQKLFEQKSVYFLGYKVFDSITNHYLGDIREEEETNNVFRYNRKLLELTIDVVSEVGIKSSAYEVIPEFEDKPILTINYDEGEHIIYLNNLYECILGYTYSNINRITPTYSSYWTSINLPEYQRLDVTDNTISLVDKYSQAIDFLKGFTYSFT
jgi:hypothetical protein